MNNVVTANQLKVKGVSALEKIVGDGLEAVIEVRGIAKYVVLPLDEYQRLMDLDLEAAVKSAKKDLKNGKYHDSLEKHLNEILDA